MRKYNRNSPVQALSALLAMFAIAALSPSAWAATPRGLYFTYGDWELACDNTRTCRAAGYHSDRDQQTISVLLTRPAGPRQPVTGELKIGESSDPPKTSPATTQYAMRINGRDLGHTTVAANTSTGALSASQVVALLEALRHDSQIEWLAGGQRWRLSDKGAAAVLLKMDDVQGRVGTQGALIRKGPAAENTVLQPLPAPVVMAAPLARPRPGDKALFATLSKGLHEVLRATVRGGDDCSELLERKTPEPELTFTRLTDTQLLVSTPCWRAAYNGGLGFWVINDKPPSRPVLVTTSGSDHDDGTISAGHKGRGLGDCWSRNAWTWNGTQFVHTEESTTGLCRSFLGGAWSLPTLVTQVRRSAR